MFYSLALLLISGLAAGALCQRVKLPPLLGMLAAGILFGPSGLNLLSADLLALSPVLRKIALIIILARAGLSLNLDDLRRVGRPALLLCFLPACFEILGMLLLAPRLLGISTVEAALMGAVVAAVSPAVVVPKMLKLMEEGYGQKGLPQMILAAASVDDVFVIVLFSAFLGLAQSGDFSAAALGRIPLSLLMGIALGVGTGALLAAFWRRFHLRDTVKLILLLALAFLFVALEDECPVDLPFSALVAVICAGVFVRRGSGEAAVRLSARFARLWVAAEVFLFVLVGASVDLHYALLAGGSAILLVFGVLLFRMAGVFVCLLKTGFSLRERLFCMIAYLPKATVQAAIGGVPLAVGLACGESILTVAVLAILLTAPLGAFVIDRTYKILLPKKLLTPAGEGGEVSG